MSILNVLSECIQQEDDLFCFFFDRRWFENNWYPNSLHAFSVTDAVRLWEIICTVKERVIQRMRRKRNSQMHQSTWMRQN